MRHKHGYKRLGRESSHRRAMLRNMTTSLLKHERITTTVTKAKELRSFVDKMITLGKRGDLHARRQVESWLFDKDAAKKVFTEIAPRMKERQGGYTRILRKGTRFGDGAQMAFIELVDYDHEKAVTVNED